MVVQWAVEESVIVLEDVTGDLHVLCVLRLTEIECPGVLTFLRGETIDANSTSFLARTIYTSSTAVTPAALWHLSVNKLDYHSLQSNRTQKFVTQFFIIPQGSHLFALGNSMRRRSLIGLSVTASFLHYICFSIPGSMFSGF